MDSDLYPHRGFMLDMGRRFFPVQAILELLTVLHEYNLTVFSLAYIRCKKFPSFWPADSGLTKTSMEYHHTSNYYTSEDIQSVFSYAQSVGILVYPETDMPGHSDIWCCFGIIYSLLIDRVLESFLLGECGRKI
jgi:hexosaminidase